MSEEEQRNRISQNIENQITFIGGVETFLESGCDSSIILSETYFLSNPNANNWILGDWTYQQFINSYISVMNSNPQTTKCPLETPFFNGNQCVNCVYPNNVFNMKDAKCSNCEYSLIVNVKTRKCVS